jgi:hypothetical protein
MDQDNELIYTLENEKFYQMFQILWEFDILIKEFIKGSINNLNIKKENLKYSRIQ